MSSRKASRSDVSQDDALRVLQSLKDQGTLQEVLQRLQHKDNDGPRGSMTDASKRRGDDISELDGYQLVEESSSSEESDDPKVQLPKGVPDISTWGRTLCTLPKLAKLKASYDELTVKAKTSEEIASYLKWVMNNGSKSAKVQDLCDFLEAVGYDPNPKPKVPSSKCFPGTTEERVLK